MHYYLSIGTNIQPEKNAVNIIEQLARNFGPLISYPFLYTQPENILSKNIFLNSLAIIYSPLKEMEVKGLLNNIETLLGRDRQDPQRSLKDRTADIDILGFSEQYDASFFKNCHEAYIQDVAEHKAPVNLEDFGLPSTKRAATVHFNVRAGDIRILDNTADSLKHWHETALDFE